jgi:arginyl-tRNA synthetase
MAVSEFPALQGLRDSLQSIVDELAREGAAAGTPRVELERPRDESHGDYASNAALMLAPVLRQNPREVANSIAERATDIPGVAAIEVAGPGFLNVRMEDTWFVEAVRSALESGEQYGSGVLVDAKPVLLEFVSANPTGPMTAPSVRHAVFGDALARVLRHAGHDVRTEYYINDAGRQVDLFGESLIARAAGTEIPEGGYNGDYVGELASALDAKPGDDPRALGTQAIARMVADARAFLEGIDVRFDHFQSERELHESGKVDAGIAKLVESGHTVDEDGAILLRTTAFGDDRDRAIRRANGVPTYFGAEISYIEDKFERMGGDAHMILVLGADHHGYIARLKGAVQALGFDPNRYDVVILQMVSLLENGEQKKMSKRRGDFVEASEIIESVGADATRFFMLQRSHDQQVELDVELATSHSDANPVYYVQYAHARLCSIRRKVEEAGLLPDGELSLAALIEEPLNASEKRLIKRIGEFPMLVAEAAERRQPHKLTHFAHDLAADVAKFYHESRVTGENVPAAVTARRLEICDAARLVLAVALGLIGVSAPDRM